MSKFREVKVSSPNLINRQSEMKKLTEQINRSLLVHQKAGTLKLRLNMIKSQLREIK
jgi:hypothetical protein